MLQFSQISKLTRLFCCNSIVPTVEAAFSHIVYGTLHSGKSPERQMEAIPPRLLLKTTSQAFQKLHSFTKQLSDWI